MVVKRTPACVRIRAQNTNRDDKIEATKSKWKRYRCEENEGNRLEPTKSWFRPIEVNREEEDEEKGEEEVEVAGENNNNKNKNRKSSRKACPTSF